MKEYYLRWILHKLFAGNPCAEFTSPVQSGKGWVCVLKDNVNGQEYLATFIPIESVKVVLAKQECPDTADQFLKMMEKKCEEI